MSWENYGDVNPIEHGGMFVKHDSEIGGRQYYVVSIYMFDDVEKWLMIDGYVDLDDNWIEWDSVRATMNTPKDADDEYLATEIMYYYGTHIGSEEVIESEEELIERLENFGIVGLV